MVRTRKDTRKLKANAQIQPKTKTTTKRTTKNLETTLKKDETTSTAESVSRKGLQVKFNFQEKNKGPVIFQRFLIFDITMKITKDYRPILEVNLLK